MNPYAFTRGPRNPDVILVGEAWGADEARMGVPFVGQSGRELSRMLQEAGINETRVLFTNLVDAQPPKNDFTYFLFPQSEKKTAAAFDGIRAKPQLIAGLKKLELLIETAKPKLVIGAGNWPLWALTNRASISTVKGFAVPSGISKWRGSQLRTKSNVPFLPIYHPAGILRSWVDRTPTVHDLRHRGARFLEGNLAWDEAPLNYIDSPNFNQAEFMLRNWLQIADNSNELLLSIDIETKARKYIACIGLCDYTIAICIPFFYYDQSGKMVDYFTESEEISIINLLRELLNHPKVKIIGQNYIYDAQYLYRYWQIDKPVYFDTMLAHHLLFPGTPKSLDYLASLYCNQYVYWKDESQEWDDGLRHTDLWAYNCKDVVKTYEIAINLKDTIKAQGLEEQYQSQLDQWQLAFDMMKRGVNIDKGEKTRISLDLFNAAERIQSELLASMPADLQYAPSGTPWYSSPKFSMEIFYTYLGLEPILHKKTKKPTIDASSFEPLKKKAPWLSGVFDRLETLRSIKVFRSHFLEAPLSFDGRMYCSFNVGGTDTFRWSSNSNGFGEGTNLQNIPKGDE